MRKDTLKRWKAIFDNSIGVDLRAVVREHTQDSNAHDDPCEDGLRSVCWKGFLLFGPLSQSSWPKQLADSRSGYKSLRDHYLRFIDHPNDLHSTADPLADDDSSPWASLREDENNRQEIFNDVIRCMQDNFFFKEPETQRMLLDILFIYSKLNPDIGYRQGMHELLAPLLWVVHEDAIDHASVSAADRNEEGADLMLEVLDHRYREADAFSLFCAVMQTAKSFYEMGDNRDSSPIVAKSRRIHEDLLATFDPELALHLQVVGVLPQIYAIRWIRLLFGREFDFKDVLRVWDILFAENLRSDIIDMTCVAMLLRIRWTLVEADYTTAITTLTHVKLSDTPSKDDPRTLVRDAVLLDKSRNAETGASLIQKYSGKRPKSQQGPERTRLSLDESNTPDRRGSRTPQYRPSPGLSPARFSGPQKQLESLFNDVSGGIKIRAEGWTNVSRAVRGAVGEVRRNMAQYQPTQSHSRQSSVDILGNTETPRGRDGGGELNRLQRRVEELEGRNKALAKMLDGALEALRKSRPSGPASEAAEKEEVVVEETFNISLAKIQFVSVYLSDPEIPIPPEDFLGKATTQQQSEEQNARASQPESSAQGASNPAPQPQPPTDVPQLNLNEPPPSSAPPPVEGATATTKPKSSSSPPQKPLPQQPPRHLSPSPNITPREKSASPAPASTPIPASTPHPPQPRQATTVAAPPAPPATSSPPTRPSLQDASFSFMLGENRHRSSFVSSVAGLPEHERRGSTSNDRDGVGNATTSTTTAAAAARQGGGGRGEGSSADRKGSLGGGAEKGPGTGRGKLRKPGRELGGGGSGGSRGGEEDGEGWRMNSFRAKSGVEEGHGEGKGEAGDGDGDGPL